MNRDNSGAGHSVEGNVAIVTLHAATGTAVFGSTDKELIVAIGRANADGAVKAIILLFADPCPNSTGNDEISDESYSLHQLTAVQSTIEASRKPIVAAMAGTVSGQWFKIALTCHSRVALVSACCGLSDIHRGLVPNAGSTQRLTRLVGARKALEMVLTGTPVSASAGLAMGVVDAVFEGNALRQGAIRFARNALEEQRPLETARGRCDKVQFDSNHSEIFKAARDANKRKFRGFLAPEFCVRCIEAAVNLPFDEGIHAEQELFAELATGPQSAAQRYGIEAVRKVGRIPDIPNDTATQEVNTTGVIGVGTMGTGIAMAFADAGLPVILIATRLASLERGLSAIRSEYDRIVSRGGLSPGQAALRMGLIRGQTDLHALAGVDLIVEAAVERMDIKRDIFARLDRIAQSSTILATNTSYLDIDEIARATARPEYVVGLHFFTPAHLMKLLEVIRGEKTSKEVVATAMGLGRRIGKVAVLSRVCHGFIGNRLMNARQMGADSLLLEGAMPWGVDNVLCEFGFPLGTFAMWDLAGLDVGWLKEEAREQTVKAALCERGRFGRKTGAGYYDYDAALNAAPSPVTERIIRDFAAEAGMAQRAIGSDEILERCLYPMINEGARILDDGIAIRPSDIDVIWQNGYRWPAYRGGPMFWADQVGLDKVVNRLSEFSLRFGDAFKPTKLLKQMAQQGKRFEQI